MQWELDWIDKNFHLYDSQMHAQAVKQNIVKRYKLLELTARVKQLEKELELD